MALAERTHPSQLDQIKKTEESIQKCLKSWQSKLRRLGAHPKGMWIADFDSGDGYFCWKYPEPDILFWHGYNDGFSKRRAIKRGTTPTVWVVLQSEENAAQAYP